MLTFVAIIYVTDISYNRYKSDGGVKMADPRDEKEQKEAEDKSNELVGRFDNAMYGDLLGQFGGPGAPNDDYLRGLSDASKDDYDKAGHDFRNDAEARPDGEQKPYSDD